MPLPLDRFLRYDELTAELHAVAAAHPALVAIESIGQSHEGRELWLVTVTDTATGAHDTKPAHWIDASIHSVEYTATVAALSLIEQLVTGFGTDPTVTRALQTRTFYIVPRVNPDGAEWGLADSPRYRRSSVRAWPWPDAHLAPGLHVQDVDGDGRVLSIRVADPVGPFTTHPDDPRVLIPVPIDGDTGDRPRYRLYDEGRVEQFDGFTVPTPGSPQRLDLNRNYPAGWGTNIPGSGDYPGSEPEVMALIRAIRARPNVCGTNHFHTSGGVLLRPSSTKPDSALPPLDVWSWKRLGERMSELTGYPVYGLFDDFTWDKNDVMAGAADDWSYEHLGVFSWTTEFWDIVHAATGERSSNDTWWLGYSPAQLLAIQRWVDQHHPELWVDWHPFDHPELGPVEIGGIDWLHVFVNPPASRLADEVRPHAGAAIAQALAAPQLDIGLGQAVHVGGDVWRVEVGVANVGWLPTTVSAHAAKEHLVKPIVAELTGDGVEVLAPTHARQELGQLAGLGAFRFDGTGGTPDRLLATWTVRVAGQATATVSVRHERAGAVSVELPIGHPAR